LLQQITTTTTTPPTTTTTTATTTTTRTTTTADPNINIKFLSNQASTTRTTLGRTETTYSTVMTTTPCICPSTTTTSTQSSSTLLTAFTTTTGWTSPDGSCICDDANYEFTIEEETSTALPTDSASGRRLRRELLEMERIQTKSKFDSKLLKNIPFLRFYYN